MANVEECTWRKSIIDQLHERNKLETHRYHDIIVQNNKLFDQANLLRIEHLQLSLQNEKLKLHTDDTASIKLKERIQFLEQKLLTQQEELTELHRRKGENSQQIIDLNVQLQEKERSLISKEASLDEAKRTNTRLLAEIELYKNNLEEASNLNQHLRDEHQALQIAFTANERKLMKIQAENNDLVKKLVIKAQEDANRMNEENDTFIRTKNAKMQEELRDAIKDTTCSIGDAEGPSCIQYSDSLLPKRAIHCVDMAHDSEINAIRWCPVNDKVFATGGADRKIKLWDITQGIKCKGVLNDSNQGIMAVDFDMKGTLLVGASNDYACRVWNLEDLRLRHTLTGHSGKVLASKFLSDQSRVVTGSHDRTLKIWDLRSRACIETKFASSSCNDLVTFDLSGSTIISGHMDMRIRFWDLRTLQSTKETELSGKVTSLDLSRDCNYLICCLRDDTLRLLDLRKNQIVKMFSCDGFKVGCDWTRATFSPDRQYVAVGSADGHVYLFNVTSGNVENILKQHSSATIATGWSPDGSLLASVDKSKRIIIWAEH